MCFHEPMLGKLQLDLVKLLGGAGDVWASPRADLLTNKLCSLLSRQEGRDLWDVRVLLEAGEDLEAAIARALTKTPGSRR